MQKLLAAASLTCAIILGNTLPVFAQTNSDYEALITKTDTPEYMVDGAKRIDHLEAHELYQKGAVFIDLRSTWRYDQAHIRGAVGLELNSQFSKESLAEHAMQNQKIVFYCNHSACDRSASASASAKALTWGYTDVYHFADGWSAWSGYNYDQD